MKYRPDIDGLRAVAVLSVLLFHAHFPATSGGFIGVDVFFVISGYLICGIVANDIANNKFSLVKFYERRCRRIVPALLSVTAVVVCLAGFVLLPRDMESFCRSLVATVLFSSNIYFWRTTKYFDGAAEFKPLLHTWSLGVEEQFYIFMPLILFCIARWSKSRYGSWLFPLSIASFLLSVWGLTHGPTASFYLLPTRFWELATGALIAVAMPSRSIHSKIRETLGAIGVFLIVYGVIRLSEESPFPGWNALFPCLGAAAIIYSGMQTPTVVSNILASRPLVFVGKISYPLYLWHWPLLALAKYQVGRELSILETSVVLAVSLFLAIASWRYVETPVRLNTQFFNSRCVFAGSFAAILLITSLGLAGTSSRGFSFRYPGFAAKRIPGQELYKRGTCFLGENQTFRDWRGNECLLTRGHSQTVLLWGDSFAAHYAPGITAAEKDVTVNVMQYTADACPPLFGYYSAARPNCSEFNENVTKLLREYDISAVIMAGRWESLFKRGTSPGSLAATADALKRMGQQVYVIGQSPVFYNDVQILFAKAGYPTDVREAAAPVSFNREINSRLAESLPHVTFIDPLSALCDSSACNYLRGGQYIVTDVGHFSLFGSQLAVASYFPFISPRTNAH
jgi:peptidoglycan/LPS O-acetylase OafA/YrhL